LNVNGRALQGALEGRSRLRVAAVGSDPVGELVVDIIQNLLAEPIEIDAARL